ncbi:MAG: glutamine--tRNA ligase/YqeY domain fusion protein [Deltaproteobacteria bacterium]|nr:glutamine--tRNA ligase/YqeY domain fusion protein [Deltaproteobacteria bacterium]
MSTTNEKPEGTPAAPGEGPSNFIRQIIDGDQANQKYGGRVATRFPPEPNGFLHIGHAKSICLNFGLARDYGGRCNLRMDDTNPEKEDMAYVEAIQKDVRWLGFEWDGLYFASDYYGKLYELAELLIKKGKAYVCSLNEEEIRQFRGTVKQPGRPSPHRARSVDENLDLFRRMRGGEFEDGAHTLRAIIDMASPNMKMRDPLLYRIRHTQHYRTGDAWCIYPMYDWAHCISDAIEGITHSICTLEFENNRELYDWFLDQVSEALPKPHPQQIEFARLNLSHTVMSKRKLLRLVNEKLVSGWDDPRMPTLAGFRRRGVTPEAIREFCDKIGVARADSVVDVALLEHTIRDDLNQKVPRVMAVLRPLKLIIDNYPEGQVEEFEAPNFPDDPPRMGSRRVAFSRELFIEREDFMENPPKKYFRLAPGQEVRLRWSYLVTATRVEKDAQGEVVAVHCTYDPATRGGNPPDGRKVKGTIHWVSAASAVDAEVRLYDYLFREDLDSDEDADFAAQLNPGSLERLATKVEASLARAEPGTRFQFERQGYFFADPEESRPSAPVFNRIVALRDSWSKIAKAGSG